MRRQFVLLAVGLFCLPVFLKAQAVTTVSSWTSSSPEKTWDKQSTAKIEAASPNTVVDFEVFPTALEQKIDGFGGCFNELGWDALKAIKPELREQILKELFDKKSGCNFSICRMPIGANDYSVDWYSLNETVGDFEMKNFSIGRDKQRLIPYIKAAYKYRPDLKVWASPWSPPSWLKTNHHYACTADARVNDLSKEGQGVEMKTQFIMEPEYLKAYAIYFRKFIEAYRMEGISIFAVHVQNEMNSCQVFPSCVWRPEDLNTFIGKYLGPELKKTSTELWLGTVERPQFERVNVMLSDPESSKFIKGVGFQWAGKGAIAAIHEAYPTLKLMQSETECGNGSNDWPAAEYTFSLMKHYLNNGANDYMYWNMVLDETGKSQWGWKQNSMISITKSTGSVVYNPEFFLMKQLSRSVLPSSIKIKSSGSLERNICFLTPDRKKLIIMVNNIENTNKDIHVKIAEQLLTATLKPHSINTFEVMLK
jgi:glucosylceramidase